MKQGNPYITLLRTAWRYARQDRRRYILVYLLFVGANLAASINPVLHGWFINSIQKAPEQIPNNTLLYAAGFLGLKLVEWAFHGPARVMERKLAFDLSRNFLQERYHQALRLPVKWHQDHHSGATINRIRKAYEALKHFFDGGFMYIHALTKFFISFVAMIYFSPRFGAVGAALGLLTVWVIFKFDKPLIKSQEDVNDGEHVISATLFDSLSNIMTVVTLRLERSMENGLLAKVGLLLPPFRRNILINEWKWFVADTLVTITYCVITVGYVYEHWLPGQVFYVGGLVTLLAYVTQFTSVFHDVAWQYTQIIQYNTDVQTAGSIAEAYDAQHRPDDTEDLPAGWRTMVLSNLNFSHRQTYDNRHAPQSLHDLRLNLERGKRVAFIGESGCGKSTLLALLRGLYDPEPGWNFTVDGKSYSLDALNETVTLFPQEPEIFENTISYNVTLDLPIAMEEIQEVCRQAHFSDVIAQLPKGLASNIQEKGVNLSGGQKQRLALARGILAARDSQVVLLDEPTSSVDPKTEAAIYEHLFEAFKDKVMISALHRLHLLRHFDYVYVLRQGRVVAEGTFADLLRDSKEFQELWKHQSKEGEAV